LAGALDGEADAVTAFEWQVAVTDGVEDVRGIGKYAVFPVEVKLLGVDPLQLRAFSTARVLQNYCCVVLAVENRVGDAGVGLGVTARL